MRQALASFTVLLCTSASLAEKIDLRGPAPEAGDTVVTTVDRIHEEHPLRMTTRLGNGRDIEFVFTRMTRLQQTIQVRILATTDACPTKTETRYLDYESVREERNNFPKSEPKRYVDTSRKGAVLTATKTERGWETVRNDAAKHIRQRGYTDPRLAYPAEPVAVGHRWEAELRDLPDAFVGRALAGEMLPKAKVKFELAEIKNTDQGRVAVIRYSVQSKKVRKDLDPSEWTLTTTLAGTGRIERNLTTYLDSVRFEATEDRQSSGVDDEGVETMVSSEVIPITVESTQRNQPADVE